MPRPPRDRTAGLFHIYTHCVWAVPRLYRDDDDRLEFLRQLARVTKTSAWACLAFCLMGSHYHLIVEVGENVLPMAMQSLNYSYARVHNRRYGRRGHVQFDRYGSRRIVDEADLLNRYAYVVRNPVEAGMCTLPEQWPWSSYAGTLGLSEPHSFVDDSRVLACLGGPMIDPRTALRRRVNDS